MNLILTRLALAAGGTAVVLLAPVAAAAPQPHVADATAEEGFCVPTEHHAPTLTVTLAAAPATVVAGRTLLVPVTVARGTVPAAGTRVSVRLRSSGNPDEHVLASGKTDAEGSSDLQVRVPATAHGSVQVEVHAQATVTKLPCHQEVAEVGSATGAWGRVTQP